MSAIDIIEEIRSSGGEIVLADDSIRLKVPARLRDKVVTGVEVQKEAIKRVLKDELGESWDSGDWYAFFDERAGIAEFDGGQTRNEAEVAALECCITEWLVRNPCGTSADRCGWCKETDLAAHPLVPYGIEEQGHVWLHPPCWPDWHQHRREQACRALKSHGIQTSAFAVLLSGLPLTADS